MDFTLRLLTDTDVPALQQVYDATPEAFRRLIGQPAPADQAARDFVQAIATPGRYQFGIQVDTKLVGLVDCKLDDQVAGQAYIGMLLLAPPYDTPDIAGLALRILERWLITTFTVGRVQTDVLAHEPQELAFWRAQGYTFTGEQYRRELPDYAPRLLTMAKDLTAISL